MPGRARRGSRHRADRTTARPRGPGTPRAAARPAGSRRVLGQVVGGTDLRLIGCPAGRGSARSRCEWSRCVPTGRSPDGMTSLSSAPRAARSPGERRSGATRVRARRCGAGVPRRQRPRLLVVLDAGVRREGAAVHPADDDAAASTSERPPMAGASARCPATSSAGPRPRRVARVRHAFDAHGRDLRSRPRQATTVTTRSGQRRRRSTSVGDPCRGPTHWSRRMPMCSLDGTWSGNRPVT